MNIFKNILVSILIIFGLFLLFSFCITVLNYFDLLSKGLYKGLIILGSAISTATGGYILGFKSLEKGYAKGIILGTSLIVILVLLSFICNKSLSIASFIYYLILFITSVISSAIGINKKVTNK